MRLVAVAGVLFLVSACGSSGHPAPRSTGPVALKSEIQLRSLGSLPGHCPPGQGQPLSALPDATQPVAAADPTGSQCYALTPAVAVVDTVARISLQPPTVSGAPWTMLLAMDPAQQTQIAAYSAAHHNPSAGATGDDADPSNYLAALVNGSVIESTDLLAPINGALQIPLGTSANGARALYASIAAG